MGTTAHEYGHVLGLPDLFNTDFLQDPDATPGDDSAGIGAWGLMGWGALGWNRNNGPTSFSAWSRVELGWLDVGEIHGESEQIELKPVNDGQLAYRIPVGKGEFFLLENRGQDGSYYDRAIPGSGLLIWHVSRRQLEGERVQTLVDLECADGQWLDAGFPLGQQPDSRHGGDNLDFWAHDVSYAKAHAGNLGWHRSLWRAVSVVYAGDESSGTEWG